MQLSNESWKSFRVEGLEQDVMVVVQDRPGPDLQPRITGCHMVADKCLGGFLLEQSTSSASGGRHHVPCVVEVDVRWVMRGRHRRHETLVEHLPGYSLDFPR